MAEQKVNRTMTVAHIEEPEDLIQRQPEKQQVPWARVILQGSSLLQNARYNKGLAFSWEERRALRLDGLLPPRVESQDTQMTRVRYNLDNCATMLDKYIYLSSLQRRNKKLFYRTLRDNLEELLPVVYTPTVGLACQRFGNIYRMASGLYISIEDRGRVANVLRNWPEPDVKCIVFTDGERILGLGDLGANGMGIPIGKLSLYTACAGINPNQTLPVVIDVGTNNAELRDHPMYMGLRRERVRGQEYDDLIEEFVVEAKRAFGSNVLLQFEDFGNSNAFRLLERYKNRAVTYNDDISGTAAVVVAGLYASAKLTGRGLPDNKYLVFGAGEAGLGIADLISLAIAEDQQIEIEEARRQIFMVDSRGLLTKDRPTGGITGHKAPFAQEHEHMGPGLEEIVKAVKPTAIIGVTAIAKAFTEGVCKAMAENTERPIIFALSNPTSKAECTAEEAYTWTKGKCVFASGSPFGTVTVDGQEFTPGQGNNAYIFPGVSMGVVCARSRRVTDRMFVVAARTLASQVSDADLALGRVYPSFRDIRRVSRRIAVAIAQEAYDVGLATVMPQPDNMLAYVKAHEWTTDYPDYHFNEDGHLAGSRPESDSEL